MTPTETERFFSLLGRRVRALRLECGMTQEDMIEHGFSLRHFQQIEAGSSINVTTLLRLAEVFRLDPSDLLAGLSEEARKR